MHSRKVCYRVLVVIVVLIGFGAPGGAVFALSFRPLVWLLALVPLWVGYLIADTAVVGRWRRHLLEDWVMGELGLPVVAQALAGIPFLPKETLQGMLATLPIVPAPLEARLTSEARRALAALSDFQRAGELRRTVIPALAVGLVAIALGAAVVLPATALAWPLLAASAALAALTLCAVGTRVFALRRCLRRIRAETPKLAPSAPASTDGSRGAPRLDVPFAAYEGSSARRDLRQRLPD